MLTNLRGPFRIGYAATAQLVFTKLDAAAVPTGRFLPTTRLGPKGT
jgi:hypothetical protein